MVTLFAVVLLATLASTVVGSTGPVVEPPYRQVHELGSTSVGCRFDAPLTDCRVRVWAKGVVDTELDLGRGGASPSVPVKDTMTGQYAGAGLAGGDCGAELTGTRGGSYFLQCRARNAAGGWSRGFALMTSSDSEVLQSSSPTPRNILASRGSDVAILLTTQVALDDCGVLTPAAGWLTLSPGQQPPSDSRYRLSGAGLGSGECGFTLVNVTEADAGVWWWTGGQGNERAFQLTVVAIAARPTEKLELRVRDSTKLLVGKNVTATCWTTPSVPPANITWLLGGKVIRADAWNATLDEDTARTALPWQPQPARQTLSHQLTSSDHGKRLECRVDHVALSGPRTKGVVLQVNYVPVVMAEKAVVRSAEGHFTELACLVDARPQATVQWTRGATAVTTSHLVTMGREGARHWLRLEDPDEHDLAAFTCTAKNAGGSTAKIITVTGAPGQPEWAGNGSASQLAWTVESYVDLTDTTLKIRRGKGGWHTVRAVVTARLNVSTLLVSHEFQPAETGNHQAYLRVGNEYGMSDTSAFHSFFAVAQASPVTRPSTASTSGACTALTSTTLDLSCTLAGDYVDCSAPVAVGTTAQFSCRPGFKLPEPNPGYLVAHCTARKRWSRRQLFDCVPDCGRRKDDGARQLSVGGEAAEVSEFPWHVGIFEKNRGSFLAVCGGSLVTPTLVVTAAHCFWDEGKRKVKNLTRYHVAAGKHTRAWETTDEDEQRVDVKALHHPVEFSGRAKRLEGDIAVIELSAAVTLTLHVNLVCIDWSNAFEHQQLSVGNSGTVPGWGLTESQTQSDTLRLVDLPYVPYQQCYDSVPRVFQPFLTLDKICGGYSNRSTSVCLGDSGGGFVFAAQSLRGPRFFLRAVVSAQPNPGTTGSACIGDHYSTFTLVSKHVPWLQAVVSSPQPDD